MEIEGLEPGASYLLSGFSKRKGGKVWQRELQADDKGRLRWLEIFPDPDEYLLDILAPGARRPVTTSHLFALPPEIAGRLPLRCDFHIHTYYSDGRQSPTEMAIRGRELGLDVLAITDHNRNHPSSEAIAGVQRLGLNLICLPGEEISFPNWHLLSIAAPMDIYAYSETDQGKAEIAAVENELAQATLAPGLTPSDYAPLKWAIRTVHRLGGRAFLAHPYWEAERRYHLNLSLYDQLVRDAECDGIELLGDVDFADNLLSVAHYQELLSKGRRMPIIGCSDTHNREHRFGGHWTIAFAEELSGEAVLDAIALGHSVACSVLGPTGERAGLRVYGPLPLVEYAFFLEREFFPLHDAICQEEAQLAYAAFWTQTNSCAALADCARKMERLYRRCF